MLGQSLALATLAVLLAWPVPILLGRARWTRRAPAVALALWQSIALAGGLSMIGALLVFGLEPFGNDLVAGSQGFARLDGFVAPWHVFALSAALLLTAHLLFNLVATVVRSERQRQRHAQLLMLLSSPLESGARLIDSPTPVAYCLPGPFSSVTVYSAGLVDLLDPHELDAVVQHERAHVAQRHDVVLIAFRAWHASLPWFPIAYRAQREVGLLVEMLADDRARRTVSPGVLARAIAAVGTGTSSHGEVASHDELSDRIRRLELKPLPLMHEALVIGGAAALLGVPTVLLFAPALLRAIA
jgi:Zn-dependent protease with chaperone function